VQVLKSKTTTQQQKQTNADIINKYLKAMEIEVNPSNKHLKAMEIEVLVKSPFAYRNQNPLEHACNEISHSQFDTLS